MGDYRGMELHDGDKVEILLLTKDDIDCGIKVGDVAKVCHSVGDSWYFCKNPEWEVEEMIMKYTQIRKING